VFTVLLNRGVASVPLPPRTPLIPSERKGVREERNRREGREGVEKKGGEGVGEKKGGGMIKGGGEMSRRRE